MLADCTFRPALEIGAFAKLEFLDEYGQPRERAARSRLCLLIKEGSYLTNHTDLNGVGTAWELTREGFRVMRESPEDRGRRVSPSP